MTETHFNASNPSGDDRAHLVEQLMKPTDLAYDMAAALSSLNAEAREQFQKLKAGREAERNRLLALPLAELKALRANQLRHAAAQKAEADAADARRKAESADKEAKKEAARIYNLPSAAADFEHWAKMDHWTFDEALALLLSKEPRVLTRSVLKEELSRDQGFTLFTGPQLPKSAFLRSYEDLRQLAERATVMKGPRLRPVDVLVWAHRTGAIAPPAELVRCVSAVLERTKGLQAQTSAPPPERSAPQALPPSMPDEPRPIKRSALVQKHSRTWPSIEADLKHANENGLQAAKGDGRGMWIEARALEWAEQRGKLTRSVARTPHAAHAPFGNRAPDSDT